MLCEKYVKDVRSVHATVIVTTETVILEISLSNFHGNWLGYSLPSDAVQIYKS